jgi:hypothetical protein
MNTRYKVMVEVEFTTDSLETAQQVANELEGVINHGRKLLTASGAGKIVDFCALPGEPQVIREVQPEELQSYSW